MPASASNPLSSVGSSQIEGDSPPKRRVLFICSGNTARSQMAEALLRHKADSFFEVCSAGTHVANVVEVTDGEEADALGVVDERALGALTQLGINTQGLASKSIAEFASQSFDFVITLCDKANQECRSYAGAKQQYAWDIAPPKSRGGETPFLATLDDISHRLDLFLRLEAPQAWLQSDVQAPFQSATDTVAASINIDPISFYKCLSDDIRLKTLMLSHYLGELCVCELMVALDEPSQPKVSRNLAVLKKANVISDRKHGQWVFYRINPLLPQWAKAVLAQTTEYNIERLEAELERVSNMKNRPDKASFCR
ncbi:metalloregulator ArsR/SmtB family transcription factor [Shewanella sp.]|uniref:metalloregulator ArsR/SmtB family transcription factor n=1 Tax=Shewanella sp. TaxID=50422 RepID=UPI004054941A